MSSALNKFQPESSNGGAAALSRLKSGRSVLLTVDDPRVLKKKRIGTTLLHILPVGEDEEGNRCFMFSMPGYGCEILCQDNFNTARLMRVGLSSRAAKTLSKELDELFKR